MLNKYGIVNNGKYYSDATSKSLNGGLVVVFTYPERIVVIRDGDHETVFFSFINDGYWFPNWLGELEHNERIQDKWDPIFERLDYDTITPDHMIEFYNDIRR